MLQASDGVFSENLELAKMKRREIEFYEIFTTFPSERWWMREPIGLYLYWILMFFKGCNILYNVFVLGGRILLLWMNFEYILL